MPHNRIVLQSDLLFDVKIGGKKMTKYVLYDVYEMGYDEIAKCNDLNMLKKCAKNYHWDTDGECMLCYKNIATGKINPIYTEWDETEKGNLTVDIIIEK